MKTVFVIVSLITIISCLSSSPTPDRATCNLLLDLHNKERNIVGLGDLTWSNDLTESSQQWANYLASTKQFYHSGTARVGENIAQATFRSNMAASLFSQWSYEKNYFNPNVRYGKDSTTDSTKEVGHYTQIVWSYTFEVGCGLANGTYMAVLVCQYRYAGNFVGNWVYKPSSSDPWKAAKPIPNPASLPKPPTPNTYPDVLDSATAKTLLDLHNEERAFVGMKPLTWSPTIAASAQAHANKQAKAGTFYLSGTGGLGENMQLATIGPNLVKMMFNSWANEKIYFDATQKYPKCAINNKMISHYTQVVWSASKELGCGLATNSKNSILVCQYTLAGNYRGNYVVYPAPSANFKFTLND